MLGNKAPTVDLNLLLDQAARNFTLDLLATAAVALATAAVIVGSPDWNSPARVALGLLAVLVLPGYALTSALYPRRDELDGFERISLTLALSVAVVPIIGLLLNYTPWGVRLVPVAVSVTAFILLMTAIAAMRRSRLPPTVGFHLAVTSSALRGAVLPAIASVAILSGLAVLASTLHTEEEFTEFYVLGHDGQLNSLPEQLTPGDTYVLMFGIENHEGDDVQYAIKALTAEGRRVVASVKVFDGTTWKRTVELTAPHGTGRTSVPFELHRQGASGPYRSLHLLVDLHSAPEERSTGTRPCPASSVGPGDGHPGGTHDL